MFLNLIYLGVEAACSEPKLIIHFIENKRREFLRNILIFGV